MDSGIAAELAVHCAQGRDTERAKRYLLQAAASGRPAAEFLLNMIERTD